MTRKVYKSSILLLAIAVIIAALCLTFPARVYAEDDPADGNYMVNDGGITLYSFSSGGSGVNNYLPVIQAPATYFLSFTAGDSDATLKQIGYYKVKYDSADYYVKIPEFRAKCTRYDDSKYGALSSITGAKTAFAILPSDLFTDAQATGIRLYSPEYSEGAITSFSPINGITPALDSISKVSGLITFNSSTYYLTDYSLTIPGIPQPIQGSGYISAADVTVEGYKNLTISSVPKNSAVLDYMAAKDKEIEDNKPVINPGDKDGNNNGGNEGESKSTTNNLERIILSVVIGVLCIAVILLIFRPGKKSKSA